MAVVQVDDRPASWPRSSWIEQTVYAYVIVGLRSEHRDLLKEWLVVRWIPSCQRIPCRTHDDP